MSVFITVEGDRAVTETIRAVQDQAAGHKRVKQAVVDAMLRVAAKDESIVQKIISLLRPK